jgi:hypothetical protein
MAKVNYSHMTPAVRRSLEKAKLMKRSKCPGGEKCPYPNLLCTECKIDNGK